MRLRNKVAIVTGAGSGIGRATAALFAREGAQVVAVDMMEQNVRKTVEEIQHTGGSACAVRTDVTREPEVEKMVQASVDAYGGVDILVNNVGGGAGDQGLMDTDMADWDALIARNMKAAFLCCRSAVPEMIQRGGGAIVNISSINGLRGMGQITYSATKGGIHAMTRAIASEYARRKIRANVVCPGSIETPPWEGAFAAQPELREKIAEVYPLGRMGQPEDIAYASLYLASDEASFVSGIVLVVDGGLTSTAGRELSEIVGQWVKNVGSKPERSRRKG